MEIYLNDTFLQRETSALLTSLQLLYRLYEECSSSQMQLLMRENVDFGHICQNVEVLRRAGYVLGIFTGIKKSSANDLKLLHQENILAENATDGNITDELCTILSYCNRDCVEQLLSVPAEGEAMPGHYKILEGNVTQIANLQSVSQLRQYRLGHPIPKTIVEVFDRVQQYCDMVVFTDKAKKTAAKREREYRTVGYDKILTLFRVASESWKSILNW